LEVLERFQEMKKGYPMRGYMHSNRKYWEAIRFFSRMTADDALGIGVMAMTQ